MAAVSDLLSPQCAQDARRFKRLLKVGWVGLLVAAGGCVHLEMLSLLLLRLLLLLHLLLLLCLLCHGGL